MAVQADTDADGEVLWVAENTVFLSDQDGAQLNSYPSWDQYFVDRASAADFDGDGQMEICYQSNDTVSVAELDGTVNWSMPAVDATIGTTCVSTDLDGDGVREVLISDSLSWHVRDGADGHALVTEEDWTSATFFEQPIMIDVNGDGSSEILNSCAAPRLSHCRASEKPLIVYTNPDQAWAPTFPLWPYDTYSGVGMDPDGTVQRTADPSWTTTALWRGSPANPVFGLDLRAELLEACVSSCTEDAAQVRVSARLANLGPDEALADTALAVYALDVDGNRSLLQVIHLEDIAADSYTWYEGDPYVDNGKTTPSYELVTTLGVARHGLVFVAGDDGTGVLPEDECSVGDNEVTWSPATLCGEG